MTTAGMQATTGVKATTGPPVDFSPIAIGLVEA